MKFPITIADLPVTQAVQLLGATPELVVIEAAGERFACDRTTGEAVTLPASFTPLPAAPVDITVQDVRFAVQASPPAILRGGGIAYVLRGQAQAVLLPGIGAFGLAVPANRSFPVLVPTLIGASGELVELATIPVWTVNDRSSYDLDTSIPWTLIVEPTARVVVIATPRRVSWITFEVVAATLAWNRDRIDVEVARKPKLAFAALDTFWHERPVARIEAPGDLAARQLGRDVLDRFARLRALGVAPELDDTAITNLFVIEVLAPDLFGYSASSTGPASRVSQLLAFHYAKQSTPDVLIGAGAALRAARANLTRSTGDRRFVAIADGGTAPWVFVALPPEVRAAIVEQDLLRLAPEPPPPPEFDPEDPLSVAQALGRFIAGIHDIVPSDGELVLRLSPDAAHRLVQALEP